MTPNLTLRQEDDALSRMASVRLQLHLGSVWGWRCGWCRIRDLTVYHQRRQMSYPIADFLLKADAILDTLSRLWRYITGVVRTAPQTATPWLRLTPILVGYHEADDLSRRLSAMFSSILLRFSTLFLHYCLFSFLQPFSAISWANTSKQQELLQNSQLFWAKKY